jgi:mannose-1-phosphate guanylyltransferase
VVRPADGRGNVVVGGATAVAAVEGDGNVIVAEEGAPYIGVLGVRDLVVVATRDAVLVIPKERAQDVRQLVEAAKQAGRDDLL